MKDWKENLIQELGDLCHESYLGFNSVNNGQYEYCYKNEVVNLLDTPEAKAIIDKYIKQIIDDIPEYGSNDERYQGNKELKQQLKSKYL